VLAQNHGKVKKRGCAIFEKNSVLPANKEMGNESRTCNEIENDKTANQGGESLSIDAQTKCR